VDRLWKIIFGIVVLFGSIQVIPIVLKPLEIYLGINKLTLNILQILIIAILATWFRKREKFLYLSHILFAISFFYIITTLMYLVSYGSKV